MFAGVRPFHLRPYRNVKKTFGVDSHFEPRAIHTTAASQRSADWRLAACRWPVEGNRVDVGATRLNERFGHARQPTGSA